MRKVIYIAIAALFASAAVAFASGSAQKSHSGIKVSKTTSRFCVYVDHRGGETNGDMSVLPKFNYRTCIVGKRGLKGTRGAKGAAGTDGQDGTRGLTGATGTVGQRGATGAAGVSPVIHRLDGDFAGTNATVATSLDGVQFGPYPDGGAWGGSVVYTGANGLTLGEITQLSYTVMHSSLNDSPIAAPYLRIFLEGDTHDVIFDPTQCATVVPNEDQFNTFEVTTGDVRYDDDACDGVPPDQQAWADVVAAHGAEEISGIYVTAGFAGGAPLAAILRTFSINGNSTTFGS
jgi:hypothetical protein